MNSPWIKGHIFHALDIDILIQVITNNFSTPSYCYFSGPFCWTQSRPTQNMPSTFIRKKAIIIIIISVGMTSSQITSHPATITLVLHCAEHTVDITYLVLLFEWRRLFRWVWLRDLRDLELCSLRADFTDSVSIPVRVWYPYRPAGRK